MVVANPGEIAAVRRAVAPQARAAGRSAMPGEITSGARAGAVVVAERNNKNKHPEAKISKALETVRKTGFSFFMIGWVQVSWSPLPLPVLPGFAWVAGTLAVTASKLGLTGIAKSFASAGTTINMALKPLSDTLHNASVAELHKVPGSLLRGAADVAGGVVGKDHLESVFREPGWIQSWFKKPVDLSAVSPELEHTIDHLRTMETSTLSGKEGLVTLANKIDGLKTAAKNLTAHIESNLGRSRFARGAGGVAVATKAMTVTQATEAGRLLQHVNAELAVAEKTAAAFAAKNNSFVRGWAKPIRGLADTVDGKIASGMDSVRGTVAPVTSRVRESIGGSTIGRWFNNQAQNVLNSRHAGAAAKAEAHVESLAKVFEEAPRNWLQRLTLCAPTPVKMPEALGTALEHVNNAALLHKGTSKAVVALKSAAAELAKQASTAAKPEVRQQATHVLDAVNKAIGSTTKADVLGQVAKGGLGELVGNIAKSAGKTNLMTAIIGVAVLAGTGIAFLNARMQNREEETALAEFKADAGAHSELAASVEKSAVSGLAGRYAGAALNAAGEAMMLKGDMSALIPQMALGMVAGQFGGQNAVLAAHQALKNAETGVAPLELRDKFEAVKAIVAAVPAVAANGGTYNRLVSPVALAIVQQNMPLKDMMHLLNNAAAFNEFAAAVKVKMDAAAAPKAAPKADPPQTVVHAKTATMDAAKPVVAASHADKPARVHPASAPMASTTVGSIAHQGTVTEAHRTVAAAN